MTYEIQTPLTTYQFAIYPADTKFNRIAGIYIFLIIPQKDTLHPAPRHPEQACIERSRSIEGPQYSLLYSGITNNFRGRFNQHHKIEQAISLGMTHIGILKVSSGRKRKKIEREILKYLNPPLNQTWLSMSS